MEVLELEIQSESGTLDESGTGLSRQSIVSVATSTSMNSALSRSTLESIVSLYGGEETFDFQFTPEIHPVDEDRSSFIDISDDGNQEEQLQVLPFWDFEHPRSAPMPPNQSTKIDSGEEDAPSSSNKTEVIFLACSVYEFNPSTTRSIEGYPYLKYLAGEVRDSFHHFAWTALAYRFHLTGF